MAQSFENFDKPYRRGLVLGLSLAEVFLILLFLLLLASIGITASLQEEKEELEEKYQDTLAVMKEAFGKEIQMEEFTRLVESASFVENQKKQIEKLTDQLADAQKKLSELEEIKDVIDEYDISSSEVEKLIKGKELYAETLSEKIKLSEEVYELEKELSDLNKDIEIMANIIDTTKDKGRDPPCWFRLVDARNGITNEKRQKDVKIFDIKIEDDWFTVIKHDNTKTPKPIEFGNKSKLPEYPENLFKKKLSRKQFLEGFKPFYLAGENRDIQKEKCVFMVDVYDKTSTNNKIGFKDKINAVESLFVTYEVKDDKWPLN